MCCGLARNVSNGSAAYTALMRSAIRGSCGLEQMWRAHREVVRGVVRQQADAPGRVTGTGRPRVRECRL